MNTFPCLRACACAYVCVRKVVIFITLVYVYASRLSCVCVFK
jgi:hypothetical protein